MSTQAADRTGGSAGLVLVGHFDQLVAEIVRDRKAVEAAFCIIAVQPDEGREGANGEILRAFGREPVEHSAPQRERGEGGRGRKSRRTSPDTPSVT